jgi:transcription antitermination factor NusA-like protein
MSKPNDVDIENLIKKIDEKIEQLEHQENPNELLKRALIKKGIIKQNTDLSDGDIENIFDIIKTNIK